jgi:hypothetical protein
MLLVNTVFMYGRTRADAEAEMQLEEDDRHLEEDEIRQAELRRLLESD